MNLALFLGIILGLLPTYLWRFQILGFPTTFLECLVLVFLFLVLLRIQAQDFNKLRSLGYINWVVGLFLLAGVVSTLFSPEFMKALGQLKAFIIEPILLFYASVLVLKSDEDIRRVLRYLFFSAAVINLFGLVQYFTNLGLPLQFWGSGEEPKRIVSVFEYPNALALYLAPLFGFYFTLEYKKFYFTNRYWVWIGLTTMAAATILTFSRGAWLAVIFGCLFPYLIKHSLKQKIAALIILAFLILLPPIQERLTFTDASSQQHKDLLSAGVTKVIESPLLGNGLYGFRQTLADQKFRGEILNYPHNIFLNFWLELGLLGLLAFALVIFVVFDQYKISPAGIKLAAVVYLLILILHGLVDVPYFKNDLSVLFWFIVSLFYVSSDPNMTN